MKRICHSLLGVLFAAFMLGCENESGIYLDHTSDEIRLDGKTISTGSFVEFIADPSNAEVEVTVSREGGMERMSAGQLNEGLSALPEVFLSYDGPEAYFESTESMEATNMSPKALPALGR